MDIPCYECGKRTIACHDKCMDYKKWKQEREEMKARYEAEHQLMHYKSDMADERREKYRYRRGK